MKLEANHRRLQSAPSFVDFVVVFGLAFILYLMLKVLMRISNNWRLKMKARITAALEKRKLVKDPFRKSNGYSWDYCMVFPVRDVNDKQTEAQQKKSLKFIINSMAESGLQ